MEHPVFNVESGEETLELEAVLKSETVKGTMYDKRWVLQAILHLVEGRENNEEEFKCLAEMSVDVDVSQFLLESGSLNMILSGLTSSSRDEIKEISAVILANALSHDDVFASIDEKMFTVPFVLLFSESVAVMINFFKLMRIIVLKFIVIRFREEKECGSENRETSLRSVTGFLRLLNDKDVHLKISFILQSSTNQELLLKVGRFLLSVVEMACEVLDEEVDEIFEIYSTPQFLNDSVGEALRESLNDEASIFVFIELLGHFCSSDNLSSGLLDLLAEVTERYVIDLDVSHTLSDLDLISIILKICSIFWIKTPHRRTFEALMRVTLKFKDLSKSNDDDDKLMALRTNLISALKSFNSNYPEPSAEAFELLRTL